MSMPTMRRFVVAHRFRDGVYLAPGREIRNSPHFYEEPKQANSAIELMHRLLREDWITVIVNVTPVETLRREPN